MEHSLCLGRLLEPLRQRPRTSLKGVKEVPRLGAGDVSKTDLGAQHVVAGDHSHRLIARLDGLCTPQNLVVVSAVVIANPLDPSQGVVVLRVALALERVAWTVDSRPEVPDTRKALLSGISRGGNISLSIQVCLVCLLYELEYARRGNRRFDTALR